MPKIPQIICVSTDFFRTMELAYVSGKQKQEVGKRHKTMTHSKMTSRKTPQGCHVDMNWNTSPVIT